eukprot:GILJ01006966.1.p1 GENE.GILJ01006966.1~~GILJ01006966.1.p1  ORF type:complete len:1036 (-),score=169.77 GILJ01006966.1:198-3305(-)
MVDRPDTTASTTNGNWNVSPLPNNNSFNNPRTFSRMTRFGTAPSVLTPRSNFERSKQEADERLVELTMNLDSSTISLLKREFKRRNDSVDIVEFVRILKEQVAGNRIGEDEMSQLKSFVDLFKEIDMSGDGSLQWEEFTNFIIEKASVIRDRFRADAIKEYHPSEVVVQYKHDKPVDKVFYFPEIDRLACFEKDDGKLKLFNSETGAFVRTINGHSGALLAAEYVPEHNMLLTSATDRKLKFWDASTNMLHIKTFPNQNPQTALKWDPLHKLLYSAETTGEIHVMDVQHRHPKCTMSNHSDVVMDLLPMPSLEFLASASLDGTIRIWDTITGAERRVLRGHTKGVVSISFCSEFRLLASAGFDHDPLIWNPYVDSVVFRLKGHSAPLISSFCVPMTPQIITADCDGIVKVWDVRNFMCMQTLSLQDMDSRDSFGLNHFTVIHRNNQRIAFAGRKLMFYDYDKNYDPALVDESPPVGVVLNRGSLHFATPTASNVKIWNALNGRISRVYRNLMPSETTAYQMDQRQRKFILGDHDGNLAVFNFGNGAKMKDLESHEDEISHILYIPQNEVIISASWDKKIKFHDDSQPWESHVIRCINAHDDDITCLAYSKAASLLVSGSADATVRFWDIDSGKMDGLCRKHNGEITCVLCLGEYPLCLAADTTGDLLLWATRPLAFRYDLLARLTNFDSWGNTTVPILSMAWNGSDNVLYTGDESGVLKAWDFGPLMQALAAVEIFEINSHVKKRTSDLANDLFKAPNLNVTSLPLKWSIEAHKDAIRAVEFLIDPLCLASAGADKQVLTWELDGSQMGSLRQGGDPRWMFNVNLLAREAQESEAVANVIKSMNGEEEPEVTVQRPTFLQRYTSDLKKKKGRTELPPLKARALISEQTDTFDTLKFLREESMGRTLLNKSASTGMLRKTNTAVQPLGLGDPRPSYMKHRSSHTNLRSPLKESVTPVGTKKLKRFEPQELEAAKRLADALKSIDSYRSREYSDLVDRYGAVERSPSAPPSTSLRPLHGYKTASPFSTTSLKSALRK